MNLSGLYDLILEKIRDGGRRTKASDVRTVLNTISESNLNKDDGGVIKKKISYDPAVVSFSGNDIPSVDKVSSMISSIAPDITANNGITYDSETGNLSLGGELNTDTTIEGNEKVIRIGTGANPLFAINSYSSDSFLFSQESDDYYNQINSGDGIQIISQNKNDGTESNVSTIPDEGTVLTWTNGTFSSILKLFSDGISIISSINPFKAKIKTTNISADREYEFPDKSGTFAMTSDIVSAAVSSVFGRTGAVTAQTNDYTFSQIGSRPTTLSGYGITDAINISQKGASLGVAPLNSSTEIDWTYLPSRFKDVKKYGAAGDGTTDDTTAIQSAANALSDGDVLYFPPGVYLTQKIDITSKTNVSIYSQRASIKLKYIATPSGTENFAIFNITGSERVLIEGLNFIGTGDSSVEYDSTYFRYLIYVTTSGWVDISKCTFSKFSASAIYAVSLTGGTYQKGLRITNCLFYSATQGTSTSNFAFQTGIYLANNAEYSLIDNCFFYQIPTGIRITSANCSITNNIMMQLNANYNGGASFTIACLFIVAASNWGKHHIANNHINHNEGMLALIIKGDSSEQRNSGSVIGNSFLLNNTTSQDRQIYIEYCSNWAFSANNIRAQTGNLDNLVTLKNCGTLTTSQKENGIFLQGNNFYNGLYCIRNDGSNYIRIGQNSYGGTNLVQTVNSGTYMSVYEKRYTDSTFINKAAYSAIFFSKDSAFVASDIVPPQGGDGSITNWGQLFPVGRTIKEVRMSFGTHSAAGASSVVIDVRKVAVASTGLGAAITSSSGSSLGTVTYSTAGAQAAGYHKWATSGDVTWSVASGEMLFVCVSSITGTVSVTDIHVCVICE